MQTIDGMREKSTTAVVTDRILVDGGKTDAAAFSSPRWFGRLENVGRINGGMRVWGNSACGAHSHSG